MRAAGTTPGIQSFLAGTTDFSKIGNSAQVNAAKEHAQSFDNNRMVGSAGAKNMAANINTMREIDYMEAASDANIQSSWAQTGASALGSVASVFGKSVADWALVKKPALRHRVNLEASSATNDKIFTGLI